MTETTIDWKRHPELIELVKQRWAVGVSASIIADEVAKASGVMPVTRSMIIGIAHRHKMTRPASVVHSRKTRPRPIPERRVSLRARPVPPEGRTLLDLKASECHWPLGDEMAPAKFFCAEATYKNFVYCEKHYNRAMSTYRRSQRQQFYDYGARTLGGISAR